jgi:hypothetical protein
MVGLIVGLVLTLKAPHAQTMESGVAVTDPAVLASLRPERFSAGALLQPQSENPQSIANDNLFNGLLKKIKLMLLSDIRQLPLQSLDSVARNFFTAAAAKDADARRFNAELLVDKRSGFDLTGIVNRMDRAYRVVDAKRKYETCGEIRFIYRLTYDIQVADPAGGATHNVKSRLPFTMAIVMNARERDSALSCAEIAGRWLKTADMNNEALVEYLKSENGPLQYLSPSQVERVEFNLQLFRAPAGVKTDFGGDAEYLMRIFRRGAPNAQFEVFPLEDQLDRPRLLRNPRLLAALKQWLFSPPAMADLDRGIVDIPMEYLAVRAISVSPGGASRSGNDESSELFSDAEIDQAMRRFQASGRTLRTIKSPAGFRLRLDEVSCTGCHQTRTIAGFHFPGADPVGVPQSNAVYIPASAHFLSDIPRRKAIVASFAARQRPDFSRGFAARPDSKFAADLKDTQLFDGWGAPCNSGTDPSFSNWTCRAGLQCKVLFDSRHDADTGVCVTADKIAIGDPMETGKVIEDAYGNDRYQRTFPAGEATPAHYVDPVAPADRTDHNGKTDYRVAHQGYRTADSTGGFPAGMLRIDQCENLPPEATCGRVAADGFNKCVAGGRPFTECLKITKLAGLRACDRANPCREDYICTAPYEDLIPINEKNHNEAKGTCIPPYFMFQFRADGHPKSFAPPEILSKTDSGPN